MNALELIDIISTGETSKVQFKKNIPSSGHLAEEIVAMANSLGGIILVGVEDKTGEVIGLDYQRLQNIGNLATDVATNNVRPIVYIQTEVVTIEAENKKKHILVIYVKEGVNKPYKDGNLIIWVKQGHDKRKVTDNFELLRLFQDSGNLLADEMAVPNTSINDVNEDRLSEYVLKAFGKKIEDTGLSVKQLLKNIRVIGNERLTLGGLLFFGKNPQSYKPAFCIKAVSFFGNNLGGTE